MKYNISDTNLELIDRDAFLKEYGLIEVDLSAEPIFEQTLQLASKICKTESAYISIVSNEKQFILCQIGTELNTIKIEHSICQHTIKGDEVLVIPNTLEDERTKGLEIVNGADPIRFYAGAPLVNDENIKLGALCVSHVKEKQLTNEQKESLEILGKLVVDFLKQRKTLCQLIGKDQNRSTESNTSEVLINQIENVQKQLKLAKEEEEEYRNELLHITNIFPGTIAKLNKEYKYVFNNNKYLEWSGLTREQLYMLPISDLLGEDVFMRLKPLYDLVFTGETIQNEGLFQLNEEKRYLRVTYFPSKKDDVIDGAYIFSEDLTEIKSYQSQLENSNENLQNFAHIVSHDIKAPLRMIVNFGQLLKRDLEKRNVEYESEYLGFVINAGIQLTKLTTDLLDFAKIDNESIKEKVYVKTVLDIVQLNLHELIYKENAKVVSTIKDSEAIYGYRTDFILLFQNIISNAIKYHREVDPVIKISCKEIGYKIEFRIEDNGCGIPADKIEEIFQPFRRLHNEKVKTEGSGIGLSTCQKIIEKYDAAINVESEVNKGSVFTFLLPSVMEITDQGS